MLMFLAPGHAPKRGTPWMLMKANEGDLKSGGSYEVVFLQLKDVKMGLSWFLREAIAGVSRVIVE